VVEKYYHEEHEEREDIDKRSMENEKLSLAQT